MQLKLRNRDSWMRRKPKCHPSREHEAHGLCVPCYQQTPIERQRRKERLQRWRRRIARTNPDHAYLWSIKHNYGMTPDNLRYLLNKQRSKCALCRETPSSGRLVIDHNHKTLDVRGLLCRGCNIVLGQIENALPNLPKWKKYMTNKTGFYAIKS